MTPDPCLVDFWGSTVSEENYSLECRYWAWEALFPRLDRSSGLSRVVLVGPLADLLDRCLSGNLGLGRLQLLWCWEPRPLNFHSSLYLSQGGSLAFFGVTIPFSDSLPGAQSPGCLTWVRRRWTALI